MLKRFLILVFILMFNIKNTISLEGMPVFHLDPSESKQEAKYGGSQYVSLIDRIEDQKKQTEVSSSSESAQKPTKTYQVKIYGDDIKWLESEIRQVLCLLDTGRLECGLSNNNTQDPYIQSQFIEPFKRRYNGIRRLLKLKEDYQHPNTHFMYSLKYIMSKIDVSNLKQNSVLILKITLHDETVSL